MIVADPRPAEVLYVMQNLREQSLEEIVLQGMDPEAIAGRLYGNNRLTWAVYAGDAPAALIGALPVHPGVYTLFGFGTDRWKDVWRLVTLVARRDMFRAVRARGAHRAHCLSPEAHTETHRWLRMLGAKHEAALPRWGVNGEDFRMFAWVAEDL